MMPRGAHRARAEQAGAGMRRTDSLRFQRRRYGINIAFIVRAIELAELLGAPAVRIDSAMSRERELDFDARVNLFAEGLSGALQRTAASKITLGIENHGYQGNNLTFLLNVFQAVGSDRLGSTLYLGNFYWRGYPLSEVYGIIRVLAPYAKHAHVKHQLSAEQREITRKPAGICPIRMPP